MCGFKFQGPQDFISLIYPLLLMRFDVISNQINWAWIHSRSSNQSAQPTAGSSTWNRRSLGMFHRGFSQHHQLLD